LPGRSVTTGITPMPNATPHFRFECKSEADRGMRTASGANCG
jgi:hypothetical protein